MGRPITKPRTPLWTAGAGALAAERIRRARLASSGGYNMAAAMGINTAANRRPTWWQQLLGGLFVGGSPGQYGGRGAGPKWPAYAKAKAQTKPLAYTYSQSTIKKAKAMNAGAGFTGAVPQVKSMQKNLVPGTTGYTEPPAQQPAYPPGYGAAYPYGYGYGGGGGYGGYGVGGGYKATAEYPYQMGQQGAGMMTPTQGQQGGYMMQQELPRWLQKLTTWTY